jgi:voltage-gated potassium channel
MMVTLVALWRLFRILGRGLADPASRGLVLLSLLLIAGGTWFYAVAEGWSVTDALYFSVVTLTTIGFGDLVPTRDLTRIFTVVYSLLGIGVLASLIASLAVFAREDVAARGDAVRRRLGRHRDDPPR